VLNGTSPRKDDGASCLGVTSATFLLRDSPFEDHETGVRSMLCSVMKFINQFYQSIRGQIADAKSERPSEEEELA
jgi:hypothetical protein